MKRRKKPQGGPPGDRVRGLFHDICKNKMIYLLISPSFLTYAIFWIFPIFYSLFPSFHKRGGVGEKKFVGLLYFQHLLQDSTFLLSIKNALVMRTLSTTPMVALAVVLAFLLNGAFLKRKNFLRTVYYLPNIISTVTIAIIFTNVLGSKYRILNFLISCLGFDPVQWMPLTWGVHVAITAIVIWRWISYNAAILSAGLQKIPNSLYEAASLDGASTSQIFRHITVPLLNPIIQFVAITSTIGGWQLFAKAQMLVGTAGGVDKSGMTVVPYLYNQAFDNCQFGYGSAISWALVAITSFCFLISWMITRRGVN